MVGPLPDMKTINPVENSQVPTFLLVSRRAGHWEKHLARKLPVSDLTAGVLCFNAASISS